MTAPSQSPAAEEMRAWDIAERITGPCTCIDACKGRGLIAPDCAWHHMAEEIAAAILSGHDRLTEEVARLRYIVRGLLRCPEIAECAPEDKDTETDALERAARAELSEEPA